MDVVFAVKVCYDCGLKGDRLPRLDLIEIDDIGDLPDVGGEHFDAEAIEGVESHGGDEAEGAGDEQVGQRARD